MRCFRLLAGFFLGVAAPLAAQPTPQEQIEQIERLHSEGAEARGYRQSGEDVVGREAWFYFIRSFPYGTIPAGARAAAIGRTEELAAKMAQSRRGGGQPALAAAASRWEEIGPTNQGGRIRALAADPRNRLVYYAGAASGGVWKTTDGGASWQPMFDRQSAIAVGSLDVDPRNPSVVYAGTGENFPSSQSLLTNTPSYLGNGVYRSTDGGATWTNIGLSTVGAISKVYAHRQNASILYAAGAKGSGGFYRSTDGGVSWERTTVADVYDMSVNPAQSDELYIGTPNAVMRSTDAGRTFTTVTTGMTTSSGIRVSVAMAPSAPSTVYALIARGDAPNNQQHAEAYVSTNSGTSWRLLRSFGGSFFNNQGVYDNFIGVSPTDANLVFAGGIDVYRTNDGGANWWNSTRVYTGGDVHPDQHVILFHPADPELIIVGNDGGVYATEDRAGTWVWRGAGQAVTQFYRMEVDQTRPYRVYGGTQDNGTSGAFRSDRFGSEWTRVLGGDGFFVVTDRGDPNWFYAELYYGDLFRINANNPSQITKVDAGIASSDEGNWATPIAMSFADGVSLYSGRRYLWRTTNAGASWTRLDPGLADSKHTAIGLSLVDRDDIVIGTYSGVVRYSTDWGVSWGASSGVSGGAVTDIRFDPRVDNRVYLTLSGFGGRHVFRSENGGATFTDITANLPNVPCNAVEIDPEDNSRLFVATDIGVFYSPNGGGFWIPFNDGMALAPVADLRIQWATRTLVAATHGRSMFQVSLDGLIARPALIYPLGGERIVTPGNLEVRWYGIEGPVNVYFRHNASEAWRLMASGVAGSSAVITLGARASSDAAVKVEAVGGDVVLTSGPFVLVTAANVVSLGRRGSIAEAIEMRDRVIWATTRDSDTILRLRTPLLSPITPLAAVGLEGRVLDLAYDASADVFYALSAVAQAPWRRIYRMDTTARVVGELPLPEGAASAVAITMLNGRLVLATDAPAARLVSLDPVTGSVLQDVALNNGSASSRQAMSTTGTTILQGVSVRDEFGARLSEVHELSDSGALLSRTPVITSTGDGLELYGLAFDPVNGLASQTVFATDTAGLFYRFNAGVIAESPWTPATPDGPAISAPRPNPASDRVEFAVHTSGAGSIAVHVTDAAGLVYLSSQTFESGPISLDVRTLASGVYYAVFETGSGRLVRAFTVLK